MSAQSEGSAGSPNPERDLYAETRFWRAAHSYGFDNLLLTWGAGASLVAGGALLWLYLTGSFGADGLQALGVAYLSLGAALFGIVLAGLAVVAAFFDREYVSILRDADTLRYSLFGFWWVAALAVASLVASVALTVAVYAQGSEAVTAVALTVSTVLFLDALLEALALVGTLMRHGLYRAELMSRGIQLRRGGGE